MNWFKTSQQEVKDKVLVLMRSPSGGGKSTLAKELGTGGVVFSTDDYFTTPEGEYKFYGKKIGIAHEWNRKRVEKAMQDGLSPIVVDNTNIKSYEMKPSVILAKKYGYKIQFAEPNWSPKLKTPEGKWNKEFINELQKKRNLTNKTKIIPEEVVQKMIDQYDYNITEDDILKSKAPWEK